MPGAVAPAGNSAKRKRISSEKKPIKRARSESSESGEEDGQAQILLLENEIFESKKNYNNITTLFEICTRDNEDPDDSVVAAISLCRVFARLLISGELSAKSGMSDKEIVVVRWLKERYSEYKQFLLGLLVGEDTSATALTLCMRLLKIEGDNLRNAGEYNFPSRFLGGIVWMLLRPESDADARTAFTQNFVEEYDDIRFYTLEAIKNILQDEENLNPNEMINNVLDMLVGIESVPESHEELEDFYVEPPKKKSNVVFSLLQHKKRAQGAWLATMGLEMDKEHRKTILRIMADSIAPWFNQSELLMDFLSDSYDAGGSMSLLALSGIFYLIQEKNLDYPAFYRKLYSLLDPEILHSKHRSRFFRLLDTFLGSTHLPAVLVASFIKRLARLTLHAPPSGIVAVVPWIYNLLKKHPTCTFMIHREARTAEEKEMLQKEGMDDPFMMDEEDPMETKAIQSSLWELVTLQSHYHPNVATLAKIISEQFTKHAYNIEDFLDHSYGSMLGSELSKEVKKIPVVEYEIPKKIFMKQADAGVEDSLLVKLWDFN
ncbi:nucleolar complex protein-like protein [Amylocarpus encephaloides]|uniref:Nucleolar complex protein-like protein n=1 Tax=Amylocarpus encephaloides TaxID=45428 RepID=A0A9P7YP55_9HELO|nr:nucleolar complex protein-like protein [Amylocarpus encephaloides]